ncbi:hypothetical protein GCM10023213_23840 [Prosthecobacter algae]|uniref:Uncharacterized protein n=1 Tax=Prosthecobacter algae TaxID=1144682 RepID=A0ABP9P579_9BACT
MGCLGLAGESGVAEAVGSGFSATALRDALREVEGSGVTGGFIHHMQGIHGAGGYIMTFMGAALKRLPMHFWPRSREER